MPPPDTPTRKLAAIMFTDIAGFTDLSARDEEKAYGLIEKQREILKPIVSDFGGEWLKEMGDGLLLSFPSSKQAVNCAIKIQHTVKEIDELNLRIGIHQGDILEKDGDIFGDDVNVASRIEPFAAVGGIAISHKVQSDISSSPEFETKFISQPSLKGVRQDVKVYCITSHDLPETEITKVTAKLEKDVKKLWFNQKFIIGTIGLLAIAVIVIYSLIPTEKEIPSIGILMMENLGIEDDNFWSRGITEDLIIKVAGAGLIRVAPMKEILGIDIQKSFEEIAKKLRVKYLLTSSMNKKEDKFEFRCQLIEVESGISKYASKWSEPIYNSPKIVGNLAYNILKTLKVSTKQDITKTPTTNPEAYEYYLKGKYKYDKRQNMEDTEIARELLRKTIEIDENLIRARTKLAWSYYESGELDKALDIYNNTLKKAEELNNMDGISACLNDIATIYETNGNYKKALSFYKRSLKIREELDNKKGIAYTLSNIGTLYYAQGDYNNAQHYLMKSNIIFKQLDDKFGISVIQLNIGAIYFAMGNDYAALKNFQRSLSMAESIEDIIGVSQSHINIGKIYFRKGKIVEALDHYLRSYKIDYKIDNKSGMMNSLFCIGIAYYHKGEYDKAMEYLKKSYKIQTEIRIKQDLLQTLTYISLVRKNFGKEHNEKEIHNLIEEKVNIGYELNFALYQLLENESYLENAYNQVKELADNLEPDVRDEFLGYPIPIAIVEEWENIPN